MRGIRLGFTIAVLSVSVLWAGVSEADRGESSSHNKSSWSNFRRYSDKDKLRAYSHYKKFQRDSTQDELLECRANLNNAKVRLIKEKYQLRRSKRQLETCNADLHQTQKDLASCKKELAMCGQDGTSDAAPVPQTGQTLCWDSAGMSIPCAGTGQDGDIQAGVLLPDPRFTDNLDGTVTDNLTGLVWLQNANCASDLRTWDEAFQNVAELNSMGMMNGILCGDISNGGLPQTDWRLPNLKELLSLVDYGVFEPALSDSSVFTNFDPKGAAYWSSTSTVKIPGMAWFVNFDVGSISQADKRFPALLVLPVRGGLN